jgi:hypothetical protein
MSLLNVDKVDPNTGTTLTLGTSGDTVSIPTGVTIANSGTATGFGDAIPSNLVAYVTGASAPSGWSEYTSARGRMIVGLVSGGTDEGTVGTALTDEQDKTHTHTGPSHTHTGPSHTHTGGAHQHLNAFHIDSSGIMGKSGGLYGYSGTTTDFNYIASVVSGGAGTQGTDLTSSAGAVATAAGGTGATGSSGTGATGTAATSGVLAYIQLMCIKKD